MAAEGDKKARYYFPSLTNNIFSFFAIIWAPKKAFTSPARSRQQPRCGSEESNNANTYRTTPTEGIPPGELYRQIDTAEAASFLGMAKRTLELHRQNGTGPAFIRAGKRTVRYRLADLVAWQESQLRTNTIQTTRPNGGHHE